MYSLKNEKILITGGSGSLGKMLTKLLSPLNQIIVYSRNEERQFEMQKELGTTNIEYIIGDIRDYYTLSRALKGCSLAIHAAAMKDLVMCERQPTQTYLNNIEGSRVFLEAVLQSRIKKAIGISTDKAASPVNVYGASKYIMEKMFIEANQNEEQDFFCVRFGNMIDSRGSLIHSWKKNPSQEIKITHPEVSRFFFTTKEAAESVLYALQVGKKGIIYIPKMKKVKIIDILKLVTGEKEFKVIGLSPGEKLHEMLIGEEERRFCFDEGHFLVLNYAKTNDSPPLALNSEMAEEFSREELHRMIFSTES